MFARFVCVCLWFVFGIVVIVCFCLACVDLVFGLFVCVVWWCCYCCCVLLACVLGFLCCLLIVGLGLFLFVCASLFVLLLFLFVPPLRVVFVFGCLCCV